MDSGLDFLELLLDGVVQFGCLCLDGIPVLIDCNAGGHDSRTSCNERAESDHSRSDCRGDARHDADNTSDSSYQCADRCDYSSDDGKHRTDGSGHASNRDDYFLLAVVQSVPCFSCGMDDFRQLLECRNHHLEECAAQIRTDQLQFVEGDLQFIRSVQRSVEGVLD